MFVAHWRNMYFEQFYLGCLAHASYLFGSDGEAAVVDPQRDVEIYIEAAEKQGLQDSPYLRDASARRLRLGTQRTGGTHRRNHLHRQGGRRDLPSRRVSDGSELRVGRCRVKVLATPGHTLESSCLLLTDEEKSTAPLAVLTGDTLFIGDVGRPDLSKTAHPASNSPA